MELTRLAVPDRPINKKRMCLYINKVRTHTHVSILFLPVLESPEFVVPMRLSHQDRMQRFVYDHTDASLVMERASWGVGPLPKEGKTRA